jgi:3-oxoacyl-[acyl-carrier protein] reductase
MGGIDILVNNAGITRDNLFVRMSDEDWQQVLDINLTSTMHLMKSVMRTMMKQRFGRIINITSIVGVTGNVGQVNYAASKAGMIGMTKSFAQEIASRGITANCIAPGFIETAMTAELPEAVIKNMLGSIPQGRMGNADEIAATVAFLASNEASYITGQTLHVNGGMAMI